MTLSSAHVDRLRHAHPVADEETNRMHAMAHAANEWTLEQLHRLPDDGNRYELVYGELFVTPPPSVAHENLAAVLASKLHGYVTRWQLGLIFTPRAVIQARDSQVEPDLMVRQPSIAENWSELPVPILVVEIASKSTRRRDVGKKRQYYLDLAVPDYWIVERQDRAIRVIRPSEADRIANHELTWHPTGANEPFVLDVAAYFREALGDVR
jgi:Uma2 family endonuclease